MELEEPGGGMPGRLSVGESGMDFRTGGNGDF